MPAPNPPSPRDARSPENDSSRSGARGSSSSSASRSADAAPPTPTPSAGTGARERAALAEAAAQDAQEESAAPVTKKDSGPSVSCPTCGGALQPYEGANPHKVGTHLCPRCGVRHRLPETPEQTQASG